MTATAPTPPRDTAHLVDDASVGRWTQALDVWGQAEFSREWIGAWASSCGVWSDYCRRLATASSPAAMLDAGIRLMTDSLEICSRTAGARLRTAGVQAPLLNDA